MTKALLATAVVLALTGAACGGGGGGGGGGGSHCTSENATKLTGTLTVKNSAFSPNCFSVASGSTISVVNRDGRGHNFTVKRTDVAVPLPPGQTGEAPGPSPGKYDFVCAIHPAKTATIISTL